MKIKDLYLSLLSENENFFYVDKNSIGKITDINMNKADDYLKLDFKTSYGKDGTLVVKYTNFMNWYKHHINQFPDVFKTFAQEYVNQSEESREAHQEPVNEIIDDEGNIMPSTDKPSNSTNSMVGANNTWDLEKLYKTTIPNSIKYYSGALGIGIITW
jgi:hypothetical protein